MQNELLSRFKDKVPDDPRHPFYYHIYTHTLPPELCYRVIPKNKNQVNISQEWYKKNKANRRMVFDGWNNYTQFEAQLVATLKSEMRKRHGIDLTKLKKFGPRPDNSTISEYDAKHIVNGKDIFLNDDHLLRFIVARDLKMEDCVKDMLTHLQWRQCNLPMPILQDKTVKLLQYGIVYVHGRTKDLRPIIVLDIL